MCFQRSFKGIEGEGRVEGRSTIEDQQPRNSCHQICYVLVARVASGCRWNETSAGDDQHQTEDDSRQQDSREQHQRATDARAPRLADELAASAAAATLV